MTNESKINLDELASIANNKRNELKSMYQERLNLHIIAVLHNLEVRIKSEAQNGRTNGQFDYSIDEPQTIFDRLVTEFEDKIHQAVKKYDTREHSLRLQCQYFPNIKSFTIRFSY